VAGPDGALWFTDHTARIGRITTAGAITRYPLYEWAQPSGIAAGPDGNLWFTDYNNIGRITPAGEITEFPYQSGSNYPSAIATGPDGNLWFATRESIGRITTSGAITDYLLPNGNPGDLVTGPDGKLWIAEYGTRTIGRLTPVDPPGAAGSFFTVTPCRAFDSRGTRTPLAAGSVAAVPLVGRCGIPAGATAVTVNLTVTAATTSGNLRLFADGHRPLPLASAVNYAAAQTRSANAVVPLGASGATGVYVSQASGGVHLVVDVSGYFVPDAVPPSP
jgi:hypothetical protein